jgi:APA family basic amino acid/polyamine antiporter
MKTEKGALGFWTATSLVTGNMIGSGIFLLPASLAVFGGISIVGWLFSAVGSILLALVFAALARQVRGSGGPYLYTRAGFGDVPGFLMAWGYWIAIVATNAAIAIALVSYLSVFWPALAEQASLSTLVTLIFIWLLVAVNVRGIKRAGQVQLTSTVVKILPLVAVGAVGVFYLEPAHFEPWNLSGQSTFSAVTATAALTLWAFLGLESANIPAAEVRDPERNVPRAAVAGTLVAALIYIPGTIAVMGLIGPGQLAQSNAPFADAAALLWGDLLGRCWRHHFLLRCIEWLDSLFGPDPNGCSQR